MTFDRLINEILRVYIGNKHHMEGVVSLEELNLPPYDEREHPTTIDYFDLMKIIIKLRVNEKLLLIWVAGWALRLLSLGFLDSRKLRC